MKLLKTTLSVRPFQRVAYALALDSIARCELSAPGATRTIDTSAADRVSFKFNVRPDAKPGRRTIVITCDATRLQLTLTILRSTSGHAGRSVAIALGGSAGVLARAHEAATTLERARAKASRYWAAEGASVLAGFRNGQCTDWASRKRPDIVMRVTEAAEVARLLHKPFPTVDFTAKNWGTLAAAAGMTVSATPVAGAIVVWRPGVEGANAGTGHVGYVTRVDATTFSTSEENLGAPFVMGHRTEAITAVEGRVFIYP